MSVARPQRAEGIDVQEGDSGLVVKQTTIRLHELNQAAAVILMLCDGSHTTDGIVRLMQAAWGLDDAPHEEVVACLARLRTEGLLV